MGEKRNIHRVLVGKPEGEGPFGRARCSWEDSIEMDPTDIGWEGVKNSSGSELGPVLGFCEHSNELYDRHCPRPFHSIACK
jgi:hypothetical protein